MSKCPIPWNQEFDKNKKYVWISETGKNTCEECKSLDGKIFSGDKVPLRPHPNCKCSVREITPLEKTNIYLLKNLGYSYGKIHTKIFNMPESINLLKIAMDKKSNNQSYINQNGTLYYSIYNIKDKQKQKQILDRIHQDMPETDDCKVIVFNENSSIANKIVNSNAIKDFLINNMQKIRIFGTTDNSKITFNSFDSDLYSALHGVDIKNIKFDENREYITCQIEDFYNFEKGRTSLKGLWGRTMQNDQEIIPYYVIINIKIPKSVWDNYKI